MSTLAEIIQLGKEMGLEGPDLQQFVKQREDSLREDRAREREDRAREREAHQLQVEMEEKEKERRFELRKLELENEKARLANTNNGEKHKSGMCTPAFPKLPVFNENTDSIDAYILRFERLATSAGWDKAIWAVSLSSLLQGKALETYQHLSPAEAKDFDCVKEALLKSFQCTAEGYRVKFRTAGFYKNETASQFANRLKNFFQRWIDLAGCEESFEDIVDLILMEQFMLKCEKNMVLFLKEHEAQTFNQLIKIADLYIEAHGTPGRKVGSEMVTKPSSQGASVQDEVRKGVVSKPSKRGCFVCGKNNHLAKDCFHKYDHRSSFKGKSEQSKYSDKAAVAKGLGKLKIAKGTVEGKKVDVLRDPGCTTVLVKESLVPKGKFTGNTIRVTLANRMEFDYPEAKISMDTPFFVGESFAACLKTPICDLVIGEIEGATDGKVKSEVSAVTTRQQSRSEQTKLTPKLKVKEVLEVLRSKDIGQQQKDDKTLDKLRTYVNEKKVFHKGRVVHSFVVKRGVLYRKVEDGSQTSDQLIVPQSSREAVMHLAHSALMGGHLGIKKTLSRIESKFFWPGMSSGIARFCRSCDECQRTVDKGRVARAKLGRMPIIQDPFSRVAVDIVGPIEPRASDGSRYILTIVDYATRYPEAIALRNIDTVSVAEALLEVFSRVGIPKEILSDRGAQFTSDMMQEFCRLLSIRNIFTTPYHAMCNGMVERFNGVLKSMLKRMCREQPKQWPRFINPLLFAYRDVPQASTKFSPFEMIYGHVVRGPLSLLRELWEGNEQEVGEETRTTYEYVIDLRERLHETCKVARQELEKAGESYQAYYDRKAKDRTLKIGQKVLLLLPTSNNKLLAQWKGPYVVIKKANRWNYVIDVDGSQRKFHINMLKLYHTRDEDQTSRGGMVSASVAVINEELDEEGTIEGSPNFRQTEGINEVIVSHSLSSEQSAELKREIVPYQAVFSDVPGRTTLLKHAIKLRDDTPIRCKSYPIPFSMQEELDKDVRRMIDMGVVEPSTSPYSTPLIVVKSKNKSNRYCLDFRKINKQTIFDAEPMPSQESIMTKLSKSRHFSKLDLSKGYWQIPLDEQSKEVTAFPTSKGLFQFTMMPFGLVNAGATFNRMMRLLFKDQANVEIFVDDILIHTAKWEDHVRVIKEVLGKLQSAGLTVRPSKCELGQFEVEYLGHKVGGGEMSPVADKVASITDMQVPTTKKQVRSFLGMVGYYRQYIPNYASIATPLTNLTKKLSPNKIVWEESHQESFDKLKMCLSNKPILKLVDLSKGFILQTDASDTGLGAVLLQHVDGERCPVAYASRKLNAAENNYSVIEKECLAIVWALKKFYQFLYGTHFCIETDHQPLKYVQSASQLNGRLMRWAMYLQQFNFTVVSLTGNENIGADCLSRL